METNKYIVNIEEMDFGYNDLKVFSSFSFYSESRVTILKGPSGCGKTTLVKLLSGVLVPRHVKTLNVPKESTVILQSDSLAPWLTGWQNLLYFACTDPDDVRQHSLFPLIEAFVDQLACQMSFGQRRTLELVRAFLGRRHFLLLDEPLNYLDRPRRNRIIEYLSEQLPKTVRVVLTTHLDGEEAIADSDCFEFFGEPPHEGLNLAKRSI